MNKENIEEINKIINKDSDIMNIKIKYLRI